MPKLGIIRKPLGNTTYDWERGSRGKGKRPNRNGITVAGGYTDFGFVEMGAFLVTRVSPIFGNTGRDTFASLVWNIMLNRAIVDQ